MSVLVRLYPAAWRERYGDELAVVLEDRPPGPFDVADLLLGALDAHLYLRGLGNRSNHRKGIPMSLRLAGYAAVASGLFWILFIALAVISSAGDVELPVGFLVVPVFALALLVAMAGLSAFQFRDHPRWIWLSFLAPAAGILIMIAGVVTLPLGDDPLVAGLSPWYLGTLGLMLTLIGSCIFAVVTIATGALSRTAAAGVAIGAPITVIILVGLGPDGSLLAGAVAVAASIAFGLGWIGLGIDAIRRDRAAVPAGPAAA